MSKEIINKKGVKIAFFGTSDFAVPILESLAKNKYKITAVVTTPDEPTGRKQILTPPPVKPAAQKKLLEILQPRILKNDREFISRLKSFSPDLGILVSYGKIIPEEVIQIFKYGIINIHPSILPKYRGPSPIQTAILNGDQETGVTIIKIDNELDHGDIVAKSKKVKIADKNYQELHAELAEVGADLLIKTLPDYIAGKIKETPQDHLIATFTKLFSKNDGKIDWHTEAKEIFNKFRAFRIWPGIWTTWNNKILKISDCRIYESQPYHKHEEIYIAGVYEENGHIFIPCRVGHVELSRIRLEGGKELSVKEFIAGHRNFIGSKLGI